MRWCSAATRKANVRRWSFLPDPVPGQTIEDVCLAEAAFVEKVGEMHPNADGKPCLIGNCQAG
jgi:hypothetical protein